MAKREAKLAKNLEMEYVNIPLAALANPKPEEMKMFFEVISKGKTYCHCMDGKDRTGVMCSIYEMIANNLSADDAIKHLLSKNHKPDSFPNISNLLKALETPKFAELRTELKSILTK